ncbi:hypothetical protein AA313_de0204670 [Arthrobotrys entomopaga]|nr:hypothetical protein AA313_de0204670 [Arthrobotrys entomopaga]
MWLRNLQVSHVAIILAALSVPTSAQNEYRTLTFDEYDGIAVTHALPVTDLSVSLDEVINLVTKTEPLVDLPGGGLNNNTLPTMVSKALAGMDRIEPRIGFDYTKRQAFTELRDLIAGIPNMEVTLKRDLWTTRDAQPWSRNLWTVITELSDFLANGEEVDVLDPDSVIDWIYQVVSDPVVGTYTLDQTKADDLLLACAHIGDVLGNLRERIYALLDILGGSLQTRGQSREAKFIYMNLKDVRNLNAWLNPYRNVYEDLAEDLRDLYDPNYNGMLGLGILGAVLGGLNMNFASS